MDQNTLLTSLKPSFNSKHLILLLIYFCLNQDPNIERQKSKNEGKCKLNLMT